MFRYIRIITRFHLLAGSLNPEVRRRHHKIASTLGVQRPQDRRLNNCLKQLFCYNSGMKERGENEPKTALNIVLLPDRTVFNKALTFSYRVTRRCPSEFVLDSERYKPHITLYQGYYPDRNLAGLYDALKDIGRKNQQFEVQMGDFELSHGTFLFWNCVKTLELKALHESILEKANPLREGNIPPITAQLLPRLPDNEKAMVQATGSILNKELFHPHITITRLKNASESPLALRMLGREEKALFVPDKLAVAHLGPHGTISEIIQEIPLK